MNPFPLGEGQVRVGSYVQKVSIMEIPNEPGIVGEAICNFFGQPPSKKAINQIGDNYLWK